MKIVLGITGASGVVYGIKLMEAIRKCEEKHEIHLILSQYAKVNIELESNYDVAQIENMADVVYDNKNLAAKVSSGSFKTDATVILPCSMKTLASVSIGLADNLISRVCDVALKEGRPLVICPRETPLNAIHLENMLKLSKLGVKIIPPMPAFYNNPKELEDLFTHHSMKVLDSLGIESSIGKRW